MSFWTNYLGRDGFWNTGGIRQSWQWQPTTTAHDPSPPIILEDAPAETPSVSSYTPEDAYSFLSAARSVDLLTAFAFVPVIAAAPVVPSIASYTAEYPDLVFRAQVVAPTSSVGPINTPVPRVDSYSPEFPDLISRIGQAPATEAVQPSRIIVPFDYAPEVQEAPTRPLTPLEVALAFVPVVAPPVPEVVSYTPEFPDMVAALVPVPGGWISFPGDTTPLLAWGVESDDRVPGLPYYDTGGEVEPAYVQTTTPFSWQGDFPDLLQLDLPPVTGDLVRPVQSTTDGTIEPSTAFPRRQWPYILPGWFPLYVYRRR